MIGLVLLAACDRLVDSAPTAPSRPISKTLAPATRVPLRTLDDMFGEVAAIEPTFGGLYFEQGELHVVLTDVTRDVAAVRQAITAIFDDSRLARLPMRVDSGRYGFGQLNEWARALPRTFAISGVVSTGIDERLNRLSVGIVSDDFRDSVQSILHNAGVPSEAVLVRVRPRLELSATLDGVVRSIVGGVHIDRFSTGDLFCTLGLNVTFDGYASFLTNGHCSAVWGGSADGTPFYQASNSVSADSVGAEGREAGRFSSAADSRCPSASLICAYSDADIIAYRSAMVSSQSRGYFARATLRTRYDSNLVINAVTPTIPITSKTLFPFVGDTVDKVGARTGWTYGPVIETCETLPSILGAMTVYFVCSSTADMGSFGGDSGAGIFIYDSASGNASWAGQLFGGKLAGGVHGFFEWTVFSPLNNIQSEFGNLPATIWGT